MKGFRIIISVYVGIVTYCVLLFFFGTAGLFAMKDLEKQKQVLSDNIEDLKAINRSLSDKFEALRSDRETLKLKARELGYYGEGEKVIHISGYSAPKTFYPVGRLVKLSEPGTNPEPYFRAAGLSTAILIYILQRLLLRGNRDTKTGRSQF